MQKVVLEGHLAVTLGKDSLLRRRLNLLQRARRLDLDVLFGAVRQKRISVPEDKRWAKVNERRRESTWPGDLASPQQIYEGTAYFLMAKMAGMPCMKVTLVLSRRPARRILVWEGAEGEQAKAMSGVWTK